MKIKDQIKNRREALKIPVTELANRVGVTEQSVRHWEGGRSYPGKRHMHLLEKALSFRLDWTEGEGTPAPTAAAPSRAVAQTFDQGDLNLLIVLCALPPKAKEALGEIARMHLDAVRRAEELEAELDPEPPTSRSPSRGKVTS